MKAKLFTLGLGMLAWAGINAQTVLYEQNFESSGVIPTDITLINADGFVAFDEEDAVFNDSAWIVGTTSRVELQGTKIAIACSYYAGYAVPADDWMILPSISLDGASKLYWDAMSLTSSGNYPDEYQVLVAPSADGVTPTVAYFEENGMQLFQVLEESSAAVSNPGAGLQHRMLALSDSGFANTPVWIAFRLITGGDGGSYIGIDNIKVETTVSVAEVNSPKINIYPNPANDNVFINLNGNKSNVSVFDITGKLVKTIENVNGNCIVDVSNLAAGYYFIQAKSGTQTISQKLIVR